MAEITEYDNYHFPVKAEREEILQSGTQEEKDKMALGVLIHAFKEAYNRSLGSAKPRFFKPTARDYPFDSTMSELVDELERRKWEVPGLEVEFHGYGPRRSRGSARSRPRTSICSSAASRRR